MTDRNALLEQLSQWNPDSGDLPDEIALLLDEDEAARRLFDGRFTPAVIGSDPVPADLHSRLVLDVATQPAVADAEAPPENRGRRFGWWFAGGTGVLAIAATALLTVNLGSQEPASVGAVASQVSTPEDSTHVDPHVVMRPQTPTSAVGGRDGDRRRGEGKDRRGTLSTTMPRGAEPGAVTDPNAQILSIRISRGGDLGENREGTEMERRDLSGVQIEGLLGDEEGGEGVLNGPIGGLVFGTRGQGMGGGGLGSGQPLGRGRESANRRSGGRIAEPALRSTNGDSYGNGDVPLGATGTGGGSSEVELFAKGVDEISASEHRTLIELGYLAPETEVAMLDVLNEGEIAQDDDGEGRFLPTTGDQFTEYGVNPMENTATDALSTFSIDVDNASYTLSRRKLRDGYLPPISAVRVEEFVNYFGYDYPPPSSDPFRVDFEASPSPFTAGRHLVRVGVQGKRVGLDRKPVHLTFLVDTSGSMNSSDKLELVKRTLEMLTNELEDGDTVAIAAYAGSAGVILEPTPISQRDNIIASLRMMTSGGSTAMGAGIQLAYNLAEQQRTEGSVNRVIIASDGDANVGQTNHGTLSEGIKEYARNGITLTTLGFGQGNYRDTMMERLANDGDGNYYYIDSMAESRRLFVDNLASTMEVIAKDVKIQVEWNKDAVSAYRLIGYENRDIADQDFRNDAVDAGEIGSGHQVTALYEIVAPHGVSANMATVRVRNKAPGPEAPAVERAFTLNGSHFRPSFGETSDDFRIAVSAATFAEHLRQSPFVAEIPLEEVRRMAAGAKRPDFPEDAELIELIDTTLRLKR